MAKHIETKLGKLHKPNTQDKVCYRCLTVGSCNKQKLPVLFFNDLHSRDVINMHFCKKVLRLYHPKSPWISVDISIPKIASEACKAWGTAGFVATWRLENTGIYHTAAAGHSRACPDPQRRSKWPLGPAWGRSGARACLGAAEAFKIAARACLGIDEAI